MMQRLALAGILAGTLLAACSGGVTGPMDMPPQAVGVVTLKTVSVTLRREMPGRVSARLIAEVRPRVDGIVQRVLFTEGSVVTAGQSLYELDDAVYRAAFRSAQAQQQRAQAALDNAQRSAERGAGLMNSRMISVQDNDTLQSALAQAVAEKAVADAQADSARINLGYAHIRSPIAGRIGKSAVTQGSLATANQAQALAIVQQLDSVYVDLTQSSSEWLQLQQQLGVSTVGADSREVQIQLENGSDYPLPGRLQFSDVTVEAGTGSFLLRVLVPNPKSLLLPGMYVRATINEGVMKDALLAPQPGITRDAKGSATALVIGAGNKVEARSVVTTRAVGNQWLIASGLQPGDRLIVEGLQKIQPGMVVAPMEVSAAQVPVAPAASAPVGTKP
jgi:membrane fusion protein (multidrug efflux system)